MIPRSAKVGLATTALALVLGACTANEFKDGLHAGGKLLYDTFERMNEDQRER